MDKTQRNYEVCSALASLYSSVHGGVAEFLVVIHIPIGRLEFLNLSVIHYEIQLLYTATLRK
jgi:hypothetical protein